ncbi:interleukin-6 isoform X2 [Enhydra lutris kenyoni]|uniref:Interleukin-6 n=1 Tax=Enhydra lutris kenyoni TaxID=391180 RepID=A0A2Y9JDG5_ENHLU|nr:interleukin-6 isoform X2 [Enhydra lutris kenyoni]
MNSLSTSAFSPVAFSLGLLLVMATAFPTPGPLGGDSKDDATSNRPPLTSADKMEDFIKFILGKISALRNEMCDKYNKCEDSKEVLAENNLNLPKLAEKDRCFQSRFNQETCLTRITTGLQEFQLHLKYLESNYEGNKDNAHSVYISTKHLLQTLRPMAQNQIEVTTPDPTTDASLQALFKSQDKWLKHTTIHLILRRLEDFLQFSLRAIRIM